MALLKVRVAVTAIGASSEVASIFDDEPMCMQTVVRVSLQASKNGSQCPLWMLGSPRWMGSSLNATARTPRAALRRISSAASWGSHSGTMHSGMLRPPVSPHHSSTIQSL